MVVYPFRLLDLLNTSPSINYWVMTSRGLKQVIIVRKDVKMGKGKLAIQVAHASVYSFYLTLLRKPRLAEEWIKSGQKKVALKVDSLSEAIKIYEKALELGLVSVKIFDAGLTQLEPGTLTSIGIGPDYEDIIDQVTGNLKLL